MSIKPFALLQNGQKIELESSCIHTKSKGSLTAIFVTVTVSDSLNSDCGIVLEVPLETGKYMADYRHSEYWCQPNFGDFSAQIPDNTQALFWKEDEQYCFILPVCDAQYKCIIEGTKHAVNFKLFSWYEGLKECDSLAFVYGKSDNPFELSQQCVCYALELLGNHCKPRVQRDYPEIFEYLGWCSWDALQIHVSTTGLLQKFQEFKEKEIPIRYAIIDDMWADVPSLNKISQGTPFDEMVHIMHQSMLHSFKADPVRFPTGLKSCISQLKDQFGLQIGMWHPTTGYWNGIDPESELAKNLSAALVTSKSGLLIHGPQYEKALSFYDTFHSFLEDCGTDFVKIDNQSCIRTNFKGFLPIGETARNLHHAIEFSTSKHFKNRLINCMGMASENMFNRPSSPIARCSDDFLPENRAWFTKHILQCSYNSMVQGHFLWCDWDMWWSDDGQAIKNSVLRAISGGPIYVSDKIGRSKKEILMPLIFSDGKILRCDNPATPTKDCLIENPLTSKTAFKLWNRCNNSGVVAVFNLNENGEPVFAKVSPNDVASLQGDEFVLFEHFSREFHIIKKNEKISFYLQNQDEFKLFIIVPIVDGFAPIGLLDKFISPKSIQSVNDKEVILVEAGLFGYVRDRELHIEPHN